MLYSIMVVYFKINSQMFYLYRQLFKTGGIREAWQGVGTNCARTATVNICELVTYDIVKDAILMRNLMQDRMPCHFVSAFISGLSLEISRSLIAYCLY